MDNRWRNLGILIVVVLGVVGIFYFYPIISNLFSPTPSVQKASLDDGYKEIVSVFEKNGVLLSDLKDFNLVSVDDSGKASWSASETKVLSLRKDLLSFYDGANAKFSDKNAAELKAVSNLFIYTIDYSIKRKAILDQMSETATAFSCDSREKMTDLNALALLAYKDAISLSEMNNAFRQKYNSNSNPIDVDLQKEYQDLVFIDSFVSEAIASCEAGTA